ncbi:hypothetical protein BDW74DRAFT_104547 [Aspergillus multicolor]|uniref:uncharacterized protein n=1 Tax=Aspergillus multicolor TaxID=41759 RepID=UPI003CCDCE43
MGYFPQLRLQLSSKNDENQTIKRCWWTPSSFGLLGFIGLGLGYRSRPRLCHFEHETLTPGRSDPTIPTCQPCCAPTGCKSALNSITRLITILGAQRATRSRRQPPAKTIGPVIRKSCRL